MQKIKKPTVRQKSQIREWTEAVVFAFLIAMVIRTFVVQAFKIPSSSMVPTLQVGDHILVGKFIYGLKIPFVEKKLFSRDPARGDVVVFVYPKDKTKDFIKRVIALPGEKVQVAGREIFINDKAIKDPWGYYSQEDAGADVKENYGPVVVPPHCLFVLGDNRDNSQDSRYWGFVDTDAVKGRAFIIYFSWDTASQNLLGLIRWSRIGHIIH